MDTTRQLDHIFYSVLERISILKSTVGNMQDLFDHSTQLRLNFDQDAHALETEIQEQIDGFEGFNKQKTRIQSLESRVKKGKNKSDELTERLQSARERVLALENQEAEVQATISCMAVLQPCAFEYADKNSTASNTLGSAWGNPDHDTRLGVLKLLCTGRSAQ
jgi:septal ring factor EnvC (AmiA/AmiB activator)